jgi:hypothetical protein
LQSPAAAGATTRVKDAARDFLRRRGQNVPAAKPIWRDSANRRFSSFIVSERQLLATAHTDKAPDKPFLVAINVKDGTDAWLQPLPSQVVKGGTAIDSNGRIYTALENGQLLCFTPTK